MQFGLRAGLDPVGTVVQSLDGVANAIAEATYNSSEFFGKLWDKAVDATTTSKGIGGLTFQLDLAIGGGGLAEGLASFGGEAGLAMESGDLLATAPEILEGATEETAMIGGCRDCTAQTAEHLADSMGVDSANLDGLYDFVNNNNVGSWEQATSLIEQHTGLEAGDSLSWATAEPGHYAVFTDNHVVYGFVPEPNPNIGAYLFDRQLGNVLDAKAPQFQNAVAVPFRRGL